MPFSSRNHPFDQPERRRTKARRRLGALTSDLDAPPKGTLSLRREFFKCNESKVLPKKKTLKTMTARNIKECVYKTQHLTTWD